MNPQFALLALVLLLSACGGAPPREERFQSTETPLPVASPVESARLVTFGLSEDDIHQEIWVKLEADADVSDVFDLTVFAPLWPGVTHAKAISALGEPDSRTTDGCGEEWLMFKRPARTIVVGCDHDTGFLPLATFCSWRLYAEFQADKEVVASVLQPFIDDARASDVTVTQRTMHIQATDYSAAVTYFFDLPDGVATATWRRGALKTRRDICFGG